METNCFDSKALSNRSFIDLPLYAVLLSPCPRLISGYRVRLIVGDPQLSIQPVNKVDDSFHDLSVSPGHKKWDLPAKDPG